MRLSLTHAQYTDNVYSYFFFNFLCLICSLLPPSLSNMCTHSCKQSRKQSDRQKVRDQRDKTKYHAHIHSQFAVVKLIYGKMFCQCNQLCKRSNLPTAISAGSTVTAVVSVSQRTCDARSPDVTANDNSYSDTVT